MKTNWQTKNFEDCLDKVVYTSKIQRKDFLKSGLFPIISQESEDINGYWDDKKDLFKCKKPVVIFGDHTQVLKYVDFDFVLGADGVKILQPKEILDSRFFYFFLQSVDLKSLGYARHYRLLKEIDVSFPSLPEQHRIVKILDEVFEDTAKAKENAEKNLQNAKELFESYLQSVFANPGKDWEKKRLGDVYDVRDGTHDSPKYQKVGYALITSKNLKRDELDYQKIKYISEKDYDKINERSKVHKGDILFAMIGTIGSPVVIKTEPDFAIKNVALFKIPKEQNSYFLKYFLDSKFVIDKIMSEAKGTTQKFVGLGYLRDFKIQLPKLDEQKSIVAKLDALSAETKKLEAIYKQKLADLDELKKSVLKRAFNGEL
ncbi:MAG: Type I restriction modification DNA specificity domain protein [Candidatus Uhrbacteria bacterium GW2011_GWC2_41_11]|uniref:Type I restriction modification DNA specificity domain protein n=1 Tax=Candidatus Uhrbacteria bacterium GW2011_GWC2_41_11 TaxID=1618985 RepID=A0A0G0UIE4_9BACT|nr:MAG: Type I restriction modification DNA specificity domain protein [Candidatus Uhrbacteria bacterium GW2011_GWC2_41_11]